MNRVIKFRAWDKEAMKMSYERSFEETLSSAEYMFDPTWLLHNKEYLPYAVRFELMQFTGLLDKNGKEIYEGDILQFHFTKPMEKGAVEWGNMTHGWCIEPTHTTLAWMDDNSTLEIIGNIYENPELI